RPVNPAVIAGLIPQKITERPGARMSGSPRYALGSFCLGKPDPSKLKRPGRIAGSALNTAILLLFLGQARPIYQEIVLGSERMSEAATEIMDAAERRMRIGGFNGFSFREIAADVGVKSSSVHYHFPTKEKLAAAVIHRYTDEVAELIDQELA